MVVSAKVGLLAAGSVALLALAASCDHAGPHSAPDGRTSPTIVVDVFCTVSFDRVAREYVYDYSFLNASDSKGVVDVFGLRQVGPHDSLVVPHGWISIAGSQGAPRSVVWAAIGYGNELAGDLDFLRYPPPNAIFPGEIASGFRLRSSEPAETTGFVAEPFVSDVVDSEAEEPGPFTSIPTVWAAHVIGTVDAPRVHAADLRPNARDTTTVRASCLLSRRARVKIEVIDASGATIAVVLDRWLGPGQGTATWTGTDAHGRGVPRGDYYARVTVDGINAGRHEVRLAN